MKQRLFNLFAFLLLCTCIMAQDIDNANKLNFTPKVCVGDNFDYSYVKATTVDEKTDTIARNFNLTVSEINDTTIVMKLYFMKSTNSKMDVEDSNDPMTGVMKKCMNKTGIIAKEWQEPMLSLKAVLPFVSYQMLFQP